MHRSAMCVLQEMLKVAGVHDVNLGDFDMDIKTVSSRLLLLSALPHQAAQSLLEACVALRRSYAALLWQSL